MRDIITTLLLAATAMTAATAEVLGGPASSRGAETRPSRPLLGRLPPRDRMALLISRLPKYYANVEGASEFKQAAAGEFGPAQVKWLCGLPRDRGKHWGAWWHEVLPLLYTARAMPKASQEVKDLVRDASNRACDRIWRLRTKTDGPTCTVRETEWSCVVGALKYFGDPGLLTPAFWRTLQAQNFRDGGVLAVHATPAVLKKLQSYEGTDLWENEALREKIENFIGNVKLMLAFPQLKEVSAKYLLTVLYDLSQIEEPGRKAWLERRLETVRKTQEADKKHALQEAASQPATET